MLRSSPIVFLTLLLVVLLSRQSLAGDSEVEALIRSRGRKCRSFCFTGMRAKRRARRKCPKPYKVKRCRNKRGARGFKCKCRRSRPKKSPSPSPVPKSNGLLIVGGKSSTTAVLACTTTALFVQVQDPSSIAADGIIWNMPNTGSDICSDCNSIARKVLAVKPETDFGTLTCPSSATCVEVSTAYATLSELFSAVILDQFSLTPFANEDLEPLFGCGLSTSRRPLSENVAVRQVSRVPSTCGGWNQLNPDGRCTFSDCFLGTDGNPVNCLSCKAACDNGCGPANDPFKKAIIPSFIPLFFDFRESCCIHDKCYSSSFSKSDCDRAFLRDNLASCFDEPSDILYRLPLPLPILGTRLRCPGAAVLYYLAVNLGGDSAHVDAQAARQTYEESDECAAKCPTTQRSGGQGVTTLTVDLKKTSGTFDVSYQMFSIPDGLEVFYEGNTIFTTGGLVSGARTVPVTYGGNSTFVRVKLSAPRAGTAWDLSVACPP